MYHVWKIRYQQKKICQNDVKFVEKEYFQKNLVSKCYKIWSDNFKKLNSGNLVTASDNFCNENLAYKFLIAWKTGLDFKRKELERVQKANKFREEKLLVRVIEAWKIQAVSHAEMAAKAEILAEKLKVSKIRELLKSWRILARKNKPVREKVRAYQLDLVKRCFTAWATHFRSMTHMRNKMELLCPKILQSNQISTISAFKIWHENLLQLRRNRVKSYLVDQRYEINLLKICLTSWKSTTFPPVPDLTSIQVKINFQHWQKLVKLKILAKNLQTQRKIQIFKNWHQILQKRQTFGDNFVLKSYQTRLKLGTFQTWYQIAREKRHLEYESNISVWNWSLNLQKRCLLAWLESTRNTKQTKILEQKKLKDRQDQVKRNFIKIDAERMVTNCQNFYDQNIYVFSEKTCFNAIVYLNKWRKIARYRSQNLRSRMLENLTQSTILAGSQDPVNQVDRDLSLSKFLASGDSRNWSSCSKKSSGIIIPESFHQIRDGTGNEWKNIGLREVTNF